MYLRPAALILTVIFCAALCPVRHAASALSGDGVVVEEVEAGRVAEEAGLRAGDRILSWDRGGDNGTFDTIFGWLRFVAVTAPRGNVGLVGEREGETLTATLSPGLWGIAVRPEFPAGWVPLFAEGSRLLEAGEIDKGLSQWRSLAESAGASGDAVGRAWILMKTGEALAENQRWDEGIALLQEALTAAGGRPGDPVVTLSEAPVPA